MAFSLVLHGSVPKDEICGVIVGHGMLCSTDVMANIGETDLRCSMVLLLRRLSLFTQRPETLGSAFMVEEAL